MPLLRAPQVYPGHGVLEDVRHQVSADGLASAGLALATRPLGGALLPVSRPPEVVVEECQDGQANLGRVSVLEGELLLDGRRALADLRPRLELRVPGLVGDNAPLLLPVVVQVDVVPILPLQLRQAATSLDLFRRTLFSLHYSVGEKVEQVIVRA